MDLTNLRIPLHVDYVFRVRVVLELSVLQLIDGKAALCKVRRNIAIGEVKAVKSVSNEIERLFSSQANKIKNNFRDKSVARRSIEWQRLVPMWLQKLEHVMIDLKASIYSHDDYFFCHVY